MKDDHEERIEQLQERLEDMKKNMDEVEEELEIERRVKEREKIREELRREKAEQKGESYSKAKHIKKEEKREDRKAEKKELFSSHSDDDDDKFKYDDFEGKGSKGNFMDSIKPHLTVKNLITAAIVIGFLIGLAVLINYIVGVTSTYKANEGNLTAIQQLAGETSKQDTDATSVKSDEKKEAADTKAEENKTADTKTTETKTENKTATNTTKTAATPPLVASGTPGQLTLDFDGAGIETDESKGYGRLLRIKYKILNKKADVVKPVTVEYSITEEGISTSPKKFTLPSVMQSLPANSEVAWTIDYQTDNKGTSLTTYADTSSKIRVTLVLRDAAKKELARIAKEFDV